MSIDAVVGPRTTARLARFDGTSFTPVGRGDVDAPHVHVFVHGWQPGFQVTERLLAATDDVPAVAVWDPRVVDEKGRPLIEDYLPLMRALAELGPDHAVLWYSWLDESATEGDILQAHRSRQATQVNGRRLAESLQLALADFDPLGTSSPGSAASSPASRTTRTRRAQPTRVHLIGHSHGSAVVVHAAVSLQRPPDQVTLLDAPEDPLSRVAGANDLIALVLPRLRPGRGERSTFVDSYATVFGRPYHGRSGLSGVVDVQLTAPLSATLAPVRAINDSHLYPVEWYARSITEYLTGSARVGYGWSPLTGFDTSTLHPWYQMALAWRPFDLRRHVAEPFDVVASRLLHRDRVPTSTPTSAVLELTAQAPRGAVRVVSAKGDSMIEFDVRATGGFTGYERLVIELDAEPAFVARLAHPVPRSGRYLLLMDGRSGAHAITAQLTLPEGQVPHDVRVVIDNVRVVQGENPIPQFSLSRSATTVFSAGAVTGSVLSLGALSGLRALRRRRRRNR